MTRWNRSRIRYTPGLCGTSCTFFCRSGFSLVETAIALSPLPLPLILLLLERSTIGWIEQSLLDVRNRGEAALFSIARGAADPPLRCRRRGRADWTIMSSLTFSGVSRPTNRFMLSSTGTAGQLHSCMIRNASSNRVPVVTVGMSRRMTSPTRIVASPLRNARDQIVSR